MIPRIKIVLIIPKAFDNFLMILLDITILL